jgi:hypothetical protein
LEGRDQPFETGAIHSMSESKIGVFQLNDYEWWAGSDLEGVKAEYTKQTGCGEEDDAFDDPYELSDAEMDKLLFTYYENDDERPENKRTRTFREELDRAIAEGQTFPCVFAGTEY